MSHPFIATFDQLPAKLPVFPLAGVVVMPGAVLPLNVFELRYLNLVEHALATHRMFGMLQPDTSRSGDPQPLHATGCAGRITRYHETADGRIELILTGVCRFDVNGELPIHHGYRTVMADWSRFEHDYSVEPAASAHGKRLRGALKRYLQQHELELDWRVFEQLGDVQACNTIITALPFSDSDKQSLLETVDHIDRIRLLIALLESDDQDPATQTRH